MQEMVQLETIATGITINYVSYWNSYQAIKETMQNMVYGATKSDEPLQVSHDGTLGMVEDNYTGFSKKYLYLGESGQRNDDDGLGIVGEGWKLFLLVMAREGKYHRVSTVGFDFWGEIKTTEHDTQVLEILTEPNDRTTGTKLEMECSKEEFQKARDAFLYNQDVTKYGKSSDNSDGSILRGTSGVFINGIKIEDKEGNCPVDLAYSYSISSDLDIVNRDRKEVNHRRLFNRIGQVIFLKADEEFAREFIVRAMKGGELQEDLAKGPSFLTSFNNQLEMWKKVIRDLHGAASDENLVIPSNFPDVNQALLYKGYKLLQLPESWLSDLDYIGYSTAIEKLDTEVTKTVAESLSVEEEDTLRQSKLKLRKAFRLCSLKEYPPIHVAEDLRCPGSQVQIEGVYCNNEGEVWISQEVLQDYRRTFKTLLHELIHWHYKVDDNTKEQAKAYEEIIFHLLGR